MNSKYLRSDNYRSEFIRRWPQKHGYYRCVYCGKRIDKNHMEVDHVVPVHAVQHNFLYRLCVPYDGVNSIANLVPSCHRCNRKKGSKCGLWMIRGKFWRLCLPLYKLLQFTIIALFTFIVFYFLYGYSIPVVNQSVVAVLNKILFPFIWGICENG